MENIVVFFFIMLKEWSIYWLFRWPIIIEKLDELYLVDFFFMINFFIYKIQT